MRSLVKLPAIATTGSLAMVVTRKTTSILCGAATVCLLCATLYSDVNMRESRFVFRQRRTEHMHLLVTACGDRFEEAVTMIKSAMLHSTSPFHVHIFADDKAAFVRQFETWPKEVFYQRNYSIYAIQYPKTEDEKVWRKLFRPCASQRLFVPDILTDVDALVYVDSEVLFLRPLEDFWRLFAMFNVSQIAATAPESEGSNCRGWYCPTPHHPPIPHVPPTGVNSGVMLMNLTRMRAVNWTSDVVAYNKQYEKNITLGDQDLINIYFHFNPDRLYKLTCDWNFREDHCGDERNCERAGQIGVSLLHGSRRTFHNVRQPIFKNIYETIRDHDFGNHSKALLLERMKKCVKSAEQIGCGQFGHLFTKHLEFQIT